MKRVENSWSWFILRVGTASRKYSEPEAWKMFKQLAFLWDMKECACGETLDIIIRHRLLLVHIHSKPCSCLRQSHCIYSKRTPLRRSVVTLPLGVIPNPKAWKSTHAWGCFKSHESAALANSVMEFFMIPSACWYRSDWTVDTQAHPVVYVECGINLCSWESFLESVPERSSHIPKSITDPITEQPVNIDVTCSSPSCFPANITLLSTFTKNCQQSKPLITVREGLHQRPVIFQNRVAQVTWLHRYIVQVAHVVQKEEIIRITLHNKLTPDHKG